MEVKETSIKRHTAQNILNNVDYYKYIFKKTEKIACAGFYILRDNKSISRDDYVVADLEDASRTLSDIAIESLKENELHMAMTSRSLVHALVRLESKLRIAHAARLLGTELLQVFLQEIDTVHRAIRKYTEPEVQNPLTFVDSTYSSKRERERVVRPQPSLRVAEPGLPGRRDRVIALLRDKGEATIKDIVEVVTDCSEKTIQRELNSLIKDNIVRREGERRWSRYKLV